MSICRDSATSLWPAPDVGVFAGRDEESGDRSLRVYELPGADDSCLEGFAGSPPIFEDSAQAASAGVIGTCLTGDEAGAQAGLSAPLPRQAVFDAADEIAAALAGLFAASLQLESGIDSVAAAAVDMVETIAASIEFVCATTNVDAEISAQVQAASAAIMAAAPRLIAPGGAAAGDVADLLAAAPPLDADWSEPAAALAAVIVATIRLLGDGMAGNADGGAAALLDLALDYPAVAASEPVSAVCAAATANSAAAVDLVRLGALTAWCESLARRSHADCLDAAAATRTAVAERLGQELGHAAVAANASLYVAVQNLQSAIVQHLTRHIVEVAPWVTASAPQSMPAPWWAWRLYCNPDRALDLTPGTDVRHASAMPLSFFALAPGFAAYKCLPLGRPASPGIASPGIASPGIASPGIASVPETARVRPKVAPPGDIAVNPKR